MWNWLKDAVGKTRDQPAKPKGAAGGAKVSKVAKASTGEPAGGPAKGSGSSKSSVPPTRVDQEKPADAAERAIEAEKAAVRESFRSDPATVVAVLRAWLREDANRQSAKQE